MSSDEKALEEFENRFYSFIRGGRGSEILKFILKTRQEAKEEERQLLGWKTHDCSEMNQTNIQEAVMRERKRILGLPCMEAEGELSSPQGRNLLRRELKEEINKNI